jgi:3-methyladenine DNA glycosylase/8-oxoguanine DNA glycosylase
VSELRVEVTPPWPYRLPVMIGKDGLTRRRGGVLHRLVHEGEHRVLVRIAQLTSGNVLLGAAADDRGAASRAIERMRRALGVDLDLRPFHERFRDDPLIGPSVRANPHKRVFGRPDPFEALTWAICEQLIEYERAAAIQRRLISRFGRRCPSSGMRDAPQAGVLALQAPALFESFDLSASRSLALYRAAREVARGRVDLHDPDHERGWARLRAIPGIGSWTVQVLGLTGQGRLDQLPAGDLKFLKFVGRLRSGGDPRARATEQEVEELFAPYAPWSGLAGMHALAAAGRVGPAIIHS